MQCAHFRARVQVDLSPAPRAAARQPEVFADLHIDTALITNDDRMSVHIVVVASAVASVLSSTGIILLNKRLFSLEGFTYPVTLTGWHLLVTYGVLTIARKLSLFERYKLARRYVVCFCALDALAVALQNLSLALNSVNFYQTCKLFTIPITMGIERSMGQPFPSLMRCFSLVLITVGVALCMRVNLHANPLGFAVGLGATASTAVVLVSTTWLQKSQKISSTQLLHNIAGIDGVMLSTLGPLLDFHLSRRVVYVDYEWTRRGYVLVVCTCIFAISVNALTFYLLGKISPVSYQVIGQMKTILVYGAGYYLFDSVSDAAVTPVGTFIAIIGGIAYSVSFIFCGMKS